VIDERLIRGLHIDAADLAGAAAARAAGHAAFQASTLAALLAGRFDGDLTFAELARHGDLGLGTLNGLDGEMIALDGEFLRADADGRIAAIAPGARTPFAVVTRFEPEIAFDLEGPLDHAALLAAIDAHAPSGAPALAVRADGDFEVVHARSVPRQRPPYPTLAEAAAGQREFDLHAVSGTLVGFRFPDHVDGIELPGYHLHFVDAARERGGHVLGCRALALRVQLDTTADLHLELPPGVDLPDPETVAGAGRDDLRAIEGG